MIRQTLICRDLENLFDELKGIMMAKEYDNSNRLALWNPKDEKRKGYYKGYGEYGGLKIYDAVMIVDDSGRDNAPFAHLWWRHAETPEGQAICTPIWNNDGKLGGKIDGWWLNVWKNESGPPLTVTFKQMEKQAASGPPGVKYDDEDSIPF